MRKSLFRTATIVAILSAGSAQAAQAQQCLTRTEVHGLVGYVLPRVLSSATTTCGANAPASSFFRTRAPQLVGELEVGRDALWPLARKSFGKMSGKGESMDALPDVLMKPVLDQVIDEKVGPSITKTNCADIERIASPMSPLPAANVVNLLTELLIVAGRGDKEIKVCA